MTTHSEEQSHPMARTRLYFAVWAGLVGLTVITVGVSYLHMGNAAVLAALLIAGVKSSLVILYFMHVRFERPLIVYMILAVIATYIIFVALTFSDYYYR